MRKNSGRKPPGKKTYLLRQNPEGEEGRDPSGALFDWAHGRFRMER